jgi:transcriptional regulator with XRE-family HTH domain
MAHEGPMTFSSMDGFIGAQVCAARQGAGLSPDELGNRSGIEPLDLLAGEAGMRRFTATEIMHLTRALDVPVSALLRMPTTKGARTPDKPERRPRP